MKSSGASTCILPACDGTFEAERIMKVFAKRWDKRHSQVIDGAKSRRGLGGLLPHIKIYSKGDRLPHIKIYSKRWSVS